MSESQACVVLFLLIICQERPTTCVGGGETCRYVSDRSDVFVVQGDSAFAERVAIYRFCYGLEHGMCYRPRRALGVLVVLENLERVVATRPGVAKGIFRESSRNYHVFKYLKHVGIYTYTSERSPHLILRARTTFRHV